MCLELLINPNRMQIFDFDDQGWGSNEARRADGHAVKPIGTCCQALPTGGAAPLFEETTCCCCCWSPTALIPVQKACIQRLVMHTPL
jgi:hypothetical protein